MQGKIVADDRLTLLFFFSIDGIVRMCVPNGPLFQRCQVYDWPPFFQQNVYE